MNASFLGKGTPDMSWWGYTWLLSSSAQLTPQQICFHLLLETGPGCSVNWAPAQPQQSKGYLTLTSMSK